MLVENLDAVLGVGLQPEIYFNGFTLDRLSPAEVERTSEALRGKGVPVTTAFGPEWGGRVGQSPLCLNRS
jgi:hypothetical protein